jgi:hypothetical protein
MNDYKILSKVYILETKRYKYFRCPQEFYSRIRGRESASNVVRQIRDRVLVPQLIKYKTRTADKQFLSAV